MSDSIHTPHKHDHDHGDKHDHASHAHSCCSAPAGPSVIKLDTAVTAGARLSSFRIEAMDCPTEQTLIQNKLGKLAGVQQLEFNLINTWQAYENLSVNLELGYVVNMIDKDTWKKDSYYNGGGNGSFDKQDAWKAQVVFQYSF